MYQLNRLQDIHLEDVQLKEQYYQNFINGNINEAKKILNENPQLNNKVLNSKNLNKIIECILDLETNYIKNTDDIFKKHIEDYQISIDELVFMSTFNNTLQYEINNFVLYNEEIYFCYKIPPIATLPTNQDYWIYLGLRGEDGFKYLGIRYIGIWDKRITYDKFDVVSFSNKLFVAKIENTGQNPVNSDISWFPIMSINPQVFIVSASEPEQLEAGGVWLEIIEDNNIIKIN